MFTEIDLYEDKIMDPAYVDVDKMSLEETVEYCKSLLRGWKAAKAQKEVEDFLSSVKVEEEDEKNMEEEKIKIASSIKYSEIINLYEDLYNPHIDEDSKGVLRLINIRTAKGPLKIFGVSDEFIYWIQKHLGSEFHANSDGYNMVIARK